MKKLILGLGVLGTVFLLFSSTSSVKANGTYRIETIECSSGGSVTRCRFDGTETCDVSGQKHCDEVGASVLSVYRKGIWLLFQNQDVDIEW
jgi:hypothetical protein